MMDARIKELIALGASVAANCHPCIRHHMGKARDMGTDRTEIQQALQVGRMVRKGATDQMDELIAELHGGCCETGCTESSEMGEAEKVRESVRQGYGQIAQGQSACCGAPPDRLAEAIGYTADELAALPEGANMGLSCGNPTALAELRPGQTVLDLGSGGGFDVFIAAAKVGPNGRSIGVDMTADMVAKARAGLSQFSKKTGLTNVEFRLGEIEHLPVADAGVNVVISNCVINLSPDKPQVWREIARVLKPGGKACVSDLALKKPLPREIRQSVAALISCVGGAVLIDETLRMARQAGLHDVAVNEKAYDIDVIAECNDELYGKVKECLPASVKLSDYVASIDVTARKVPAC